MSVPRQAHRGDRTADGLLVFNFRGMAAPDTPVTEADTELYMRALAFSQIFAVRLEQHPGTGIVRFRLNLPNSQVLAPEAMWNWISQCADDERIEGGPTEWLHDVPWDALQPHRQGYLLPMDVADRIHVPTPLLPREWGGTSEEPRREYRYLPSMRFGSAKGQIDRQPVRSGGILDVARRLAVRMTELSPPWANDPWLDQRHRLLWGQARAATFLLTGYVPLIRPEQIPLPPGRGIRSQSPKHLQLAVFTAQHPNQSIRTRMEAWNARYPEWAYTRDTAFARDSSQAIVRLLGYGPGSDDRSAYILPSGSIDPVGKPAAGEEQGE
jgi:hypothetical protein